MPVDPNRAKGALQAGFQTVTHLCHVSLVVGQVMVNQLAGLTQRGHVYDILGAGPPIPFVAGSVHLLFQRHTPADVQRANPLWSVEFVSGDGQQVHSQFIHQHRNLADGLSAIGVQQRAVPVGYLGDCLDWLYSANLVVGVHDADERGLRGDSLFHLPGVNHPVFVHWQIGNPVALGLQKLAHFNDGRMLHRRGDHMIATAPVGGHRALDGVVVGLGAAAGENELVAVAFEQFGHLPACRVDTVIGIASEQVAAGRVAKVFVNVGQHCLGYPRIDWSGGVVVQVNWVHECVPAE